MTSRLTKRAVGQILSAVQDKLAQIITKFTQEDPSLVREALEHSQVKRVVARNIKDNKIGLVDPMHNRVYSTQMDIIGEKGFERAGNESPDARR